MGKRISKHQKIRHLIPTEHFELRCQQRIHKTATAVLQEDWPAAHLLIRLRTKDYWQLPNGYVMVVRPHPRTPRTGLAITVYEPSVSTEDLLNVRRTIGGDRHGKTSATHG